MYSSNKDKVFAITKFGVPLTSSLPDFLESKSLFHLAYKSDKRIRE